MEIGDGATVAEIERAYRLLVQVWHPDRFGHDTRLREQAEAKLKLINEAYHALKRHLESGGDFEPDPAAEYIDEQVMYRGGDPRLRTVRVWEHVGVWEQQGRPAVVRLTSAGLFLVTMRNGEIDEELMYPAATIHWITTKEQNWVAPGILFDPKADLARPKVWADTVVLWMADPEGIVKRFPVELCFRNDYFAGLIYKKIREKFCLIDARAADKRERELRAEAKKKNRETFRRQRQLKFEQLTAGWWPLIWGVVVCLLIIAILGVFISIPREWRPFAFDGPRANRQPTFGEPEVIPPTSVSWAVPPERLSSSELGEATQHQDAPAGGVNDDDLESGVRTAPHEQESPPLPALPDSETLVREADVKKELALRLQMAREAKARGDFTAAAEGYSRALMIDPSDLSALNSLAWLRATCHDPNLRDGQEAKRLVTRMMELQKQGATFEWYHYGTMAAVSAEQGDFRTAVSFQQKCMELIPEERRAAGAFQLKQYQLGSPHRSDL